MHGKTAANENGNGGATDVPAKLGDDLMSALRGLCEHYAAAECSSRQRRLFFPRAQSGLSSVVCENRTGRNTQTISHSKCSSRTQSVRSLVRVGVVKQWVSTCCCFCFCCCWKIAAASGCGPKVLCLRTVYPLRV